MSDNSMPIPHFQCLTEAEKAATQEGLNSRELLLIHHALLVAILLLRAFRQALSINPCPCRKRHCRTSPLTLVPCKYRARKQNKDDRSANSPSTPVSVNERTAR